MNRCFLAPHCRLNHTLQASGPLNPFSTIDTIPRMPHDAQVGFEEEFVVDVGVGQLRHL
jgi:hypothetical protein